MKASFRSTELAAYTAHAAMLSLMAAQAKTWLSKQLSPAGNLVLWPLLQTGGRTAADMAFCPFPARCARAATWSFHTRRRHLSMV